MTPADAKASLLHAEGWFKSSYSGANGGCVEVNMTVPGVVGMRDTKLAKRSPIFKFTHDGWRLFITDIAAGRSPQVHGEVRVTTGPLLTEPGAPGTNTTWHVHHLDSGETLHFTDNEWSNFQAGAREGQFTLPSAAA